MKCSKNAIWPVKKKLRTLSRIGELDKPQAALYQAAQGRLAIIVQVKVSCLLHLRGCWKQSFLKEKGNLSHERNIWAHFFSFCQTWQMSENNFWGSTSSINCLGSLHKLFWPLWSNSQDLFCNTKESVGNTTFWEEGHLSSGKKCFGAFFLFFRVSSSSGSNL